MRSILLLLTLSFTSGCATVHSWERGTLSHASMQLTPQLGDGYRMHVVPIREGALNFGGGLGGGCGCN